jgi:hypothetical protein
MSESLQNHENIQAITNAISKAAEIVDGPGADPIEVFPNPAAKERRADIVWGDDLSPEQQAAFRGVMAELGPGRESNFTSLDAGLGHSNYVAVLEGGQPHKMIAQINMMANPVDNDYFNPLPSAYYVTGATARQLSEQERSIAAELLGIHPSDSASTEFGVAEQVVESRSDFRRSAKTTLRNTEAYSMSSEAIGYVGGVPVWLIGVNRVYDGAGDYDQLTSEDKMKIVAAETDNELPVAFVTSATYQPSNNIAAAKVEKDLGVTAKVLSYGTHELARVKGGEPATPSIAQLGGEAYKTALLISTLEES